MNDIHVIPTCTICYSELGASYKICEVCVNYSLCWDCYLSNAFSINHEPTHPVHTVSLNYIDQLFQHPQYSDQLDTSDEDVDELEIDDDDIDEEEVYPHIPIVHIEIVDGPPEPEDDDEEEDPIDINAPPWEYSSPDISSSSSGSLSSTSGEDEEESLMDQFIDTLFDQSLN